MDGNTEERGGTISVFNGPDPLLRVLDSLDEESAVVGRWLAERAAEGVTTGEMSVFVRSPLEVPRARRAMACDDEVVPLQARIEAVTDEGDLEEAYFTGSARMTRATLPYCRRTA